MKFVYADISTLHNRRIVGSLFSLWRISVSLRRFLINEYVGYVCFLCDCGNPVH